MTKELKAIAQSQDCSEVYNLGDTHRKNHLGDAHIKLKP